MINIPTQNVHRPRVIQSRLQAAANGREGDIPPSTGPLDAEDHGASRRKRFMIIIEPPYQHGGRLVSTLYNDERTTHLTALPPRDDAAWFPALRYVAGVL